MEKIKLGVAVSEESLLNAIQNYYRRHPEEKSFNSLDDVLESINCMWFISDSGKEFRFVALHDPEAELNTFVPVKKQIGFKNDYFCELCKIEEFFNSSCDSPKNKLLHISADILSGFLHGNELNLGFLI